MMQMRSVLARLVIDFDVAFAPGEDGVSVWRDLKDQFNSHPGKLELLFIPRISVLPNGEVDNGDASRG